MLLVNELCDRGKIGDRGHGVIDAFVLMFILMSGLLHSYNLSLGNSPLALVLSLILIHEVGFVLLLQSLGRQTNPTSADIDKAKSA